MAAYRNEIKQLIINVPPRTLKSYLISIAFPAWVIGRQPSTKFINTSYSFTLAESLSVKCRDLVQSEWYRDLFPHVEINPVQNTKSHWETTRKGQYYADSALGTITGFGCEYMMIDDPINPYESASDTVRNNTNKNIRSTLFSRFDDARIGKMIIVMQRLHADDPSGNLLQDEGWTHVKLPAETKDRPLLITLGQKYWAMPANSLLFPARLSREILDKKRRSMGEYNYAGQMLQEPVPPGGGEFKDHWPKYFDQSGMKYKGMNIYILCDPAGGDDLNEKKKKSSDWTVFAVIGAAPDTNYYLLDMVRARLNPTERIDKLFELHKTWNNLGGKPPKVGYEKYGLQSDTHYIKKKMKDDTYRFPLVELGGRMMKEERIRRMIPDLENGQWYFPSSIMYTDEEGKTVNLVQELIKGEMATFPRSRYDDMIDAISRIYDESLEVRFPKVPLTNSAKKFKAMKHRETQSWEEA